MVWSSSHRDGDTPQIDWWFVTSLIFIGRGICHLLLSHRPSDIVLPFYGTVRWGGPNRPQGVRWRQEARRSSYGTRRCHRVGAAPRAHALSSRKIFPGGGRFFPAEIPGGASGVAGGRRVEPVDQPVDAGSCSFSCSNLAGRASLAHWLLSSSRRTSHASPCGGRKRIHPI